MNQEQLKRISARIIKLKEDLGTRKILLVLSGFCALLIVVFVIFAYRPLVVKLLNAQREFSNLQNQLVTQRDNIAALKKIDLKRRLMQQNEVSLAIDEITEQGRTFGLKFISITPKELQKHSQGNIKVLPITFKIECTYKGLGQFLAYLEEFPRSIAAVQGFSIRPREEILPKLNVEVSVNLYMEAEDAR